MDTITRIISKKHNMRIYTVSSLETATEITSIHNTTPNATYALARSISAAALLSATLKPNSNQSLLLKFSGSGPLKEISVQIDAKGRTKAYVANPQIDIENDLGGINFSKAIEAGFITVIKDLGMKEPYTSQLPLQYGSIAQDLTYYLTKSEQIPSAMILGLNLDKNGKITSSAGILLQTYPDTEETTIEMLEKNILKFGNKMSDQLKKGKKLLDIASDLIEDKNLEILDTNELKHSCSCSKDLLKTVFKGINKKELQDMLEKDKGAEVTCTFCRKKYIFTEDDLKSIIKSKK